ncbi:MAG: LacI family DNA-binding transcriptional regulator [Rariglobus sp.]|nr:LacI family DNA-binding transcriptional regulator [Rariglobus sp.]
MKNGPTSVHAVAKACGVSAMTVSRVFRNSPQVSPETRERVMAAAEKLGYRPDPQVSRLMELVRGYRAKKMRATLALIRDESTDRSPHETGCNYVQSDHVKKRAAQYGYEVAEFDPVRAGITPKRLRKILETRGIRGVLVSVGSAESFGARFDYTGFAAVTFGFGLTNPPLHRTGTNMTQGILAAAECLEARGFRRIGLAVSPWIDARSGHTYSGAWLHYQKAVPARRPVPLMLFKEAVLEKNEAEFGVWMKEHRPDVVISFHRAVPDWLVRLGLRVPEDVGFVVHDWTPDMAGFAGINHRRDHVAAAAVDLVVTQLQHNEHGVPPVPRHILIPPVFIEAVRA